MEEINNMKIYDEMEQEINNKLDDRQSNSFNSSELKQELKEEVKQETQQEYNEEEVFHDPTRDKEGKKILGPINNNMSIQQFIKDFVKLNKGWFMKNLVTICLNTPLEIVVISFLTTKIITEWGKVSNKVILKYVVFLIITYILIDSAFSYAEKINNDKIPKLEGYIRRSIVHALYEKNKRNFEDIRSGEFVQNLMKISDTAANAFSHFNYNILPLVMIAIITAIRLSMINRKIGCFFMCYVLVYAITFYYLLKRNVELSIARSAKSSEYYDYIDDMFINAKTIITSGYLNKEIHNIYSNDMSFNRAQTVEYNNLTKFKMIISTINIGMFAIAIYLVIKFYKSNKISRYDMILMLAIFIFLLGRVKQLSRNLCESVVVFGNINEMNKVIKKLYDDTRHTGVYKDFITNGTIEVRDLNFSYGDLNVIRKLTFSVGKNNPLLIIGPSGVGKTTVIQLLLGLKHYNSGSIIIDNIELSHIDIDYLRTKTSYISQTPSLFSKSIIYNLGYGLELSENELINRIKNEPLFNVINKLDLHKNIGKNGSNLSGGQRQAIILLREFIGNKPIVFLDEATASVDEKHLTDALNLIKRMAQNKTVIIVTHQHEIKKHFPNKLDLTPVL